MANRIAAIITIPANIAKVGFRVIAAIAKTITADIHSNIVPFNIIKDTKDAIRQPGSACSARAHIPFCGI